MSKCLVMIRSALVEDATHQLNGNADKASLRFLTLRHFLTPEKK